MVEVVYLVLFVAVHAKRWRFDEFNRIQTGSDEVGGPSIPLLEPVLDWLMPWLGGDCRIWLRAKRGKRVLLWRGSNDLHFRQNLKFLEETACLRVEPEELD